MLFHSIFRLILDEKGNLHLLT